MDRRWWALGISLVLVVLTVWAPSQARAEQEVKVLFNGEPVLFEVPPLIRDGRTFVPVRFVLERIEAGVSWDGDKRQVRIELGPKVVLLTIDSPVVSIDGMTREIDVAPLLYQGRTMVPLRFIAEAFGFTVGWDPEIWTVLLISPPSIPVQIPPPESPVTGTTPAVGEVTVSLPSAVKVGDRFTLQVNLRDVTDLKAVSLQLRYDPALVEALSVTAGPAVAGIEVMREVQPKEARVTYVAAIPGAASFTGSGLLLSVEFRAKASGIASFWLEPSHGESAMFLTSELRPVLVGPATTGLRIE